MAASIIQSVPFTRANRRLYRRVCWAVAFSWWAGAALGSVALLPDAKKDGLIGVLASARAAAQGTNQTDASRQLLAAALWEKLRADFPVECEWLLQDGGAEFAGEFLAANRQVERRMIERVLGEAGAVEPVLRRKFETLCAAAVPEVSSEWLALYFESAAKRRVGRLETVAKRAPRVVFTKRRTIRPSFFAYTEGQSDAQNERHFLPGAELCLLELHRAGAKVRTLLKDPGGVIRDPAVSWDGQRVLFAWKKSLNEDDYHLYELTVASGEIRQITFGLGFADYEPAYLPGGDVIFASTRCVQTVDCWWTEASNLYTCAPDGRFLRRLSFDQVHAIFPQVLDDGRVIYTRWDYNDRGQVFPQPLFQMNPDGTGQREFYGNNSWFPTTIAHARGIPGSERVLAIFCGHHTSQAGKLGVLDPSKGRQENTGAQLVAPVRPTPAERIDAYGQNGELFQYPYPLTANEFLVGYAARGWEDPGKRHGDARFGIYWMDLEGRRELLASDPLVACQQPVPLMPRAKPPVQPSSVDYRKQEGYYYLQDIHAGPGLAGVPRGTIKALRVVALEFRPAGIGKNNSRGPGGGALASTPVSIGNGSWDVKVVLGDATVREDGSAFFKVPARTPLYFQALDAKGRAVQTMRSWSTLQPGEVAACTGCHESRNTAPLPDADSGASLARATGPESLRPFGGPPRGFSFAREIQPILDRKCIGCHDDRNLAPGTKPLVGKPGESPHAFSLRSETTQDEEAKRRWSDGYLALVGARREDLAWQKKALMGDDKGRLVNWIGAQSVPEPLPPNFAGSTRSALLEMLEQGHYGVRLGQEELAKIACWIDLMVPYCGDYAEANAWTDAEKEKYQRYLGKRHAMEALEKRNIAEFLAERNGKP